MISKALTFAIIFVGLSAIIITAVPLPSHAQCNISGTIDGCIDTIASLIGGSGIHTASSSGFIGATIKTVIDFLLLLGALIAALVIVIAGIYYILSIGDEQKAARAKRIILFAILGLFVMFTAKIIRDIAEKLAKGESIDQASEQLFGILLTLANFLALLVGSLAFLVLIIAGIYYITSLGNEQRSARAKNIIVYAMVGIIVALAAATLVDSAIFIVDPTTPDIGDPIGDVRQIILRVVQAFLLLVGVIAFGALVYGGYAFLTAFGSEEKAAKAKNVVVYAVVGIAVIGISAMFVNALINAI